MQVPLCSKAVADQEAGRFASKPSHHIVILAKLAFLKALTFMKDLPITLSLINAALD